MRAVRRSRSSTTGASARSDRLAWAGAAVTVYPHDVDADELVGYDGVLSRTARATPSRSKPRRNGAPADRACPDPRDLPRPPAARARHRAQDVQAPLRPPRRQPSGARAGDDGVIVTSQNHGFAVAPGSPARRRTSRSTTAPSRAWSSAASARSRSSSTRRPAPGRTTPGGSSRRGRGGGPACQGGLTSNRSA